MCVIPIMTLRQQVLPLFLRSTASQLAFIRPIHPLRTISVVSRQLCLPILAIPSIAIPSTLHLNLPSLLADIWESILRAVPKKKTSHSKKRSRFMAGKALKDVTNLNKCSACGNVKRAHLLCPYCVRGRVYPLEDSKVVLTG